MCRPFGPHFHGGHAMMGCCCGPWGWRRPSKEERLEWLESYRDDLKRELEEVEKEIGRVRDQE
ncbi:MAG: DUF5320 domain-containing protein [Calditrichaeota bacterium]|nr:DUF5320 domain-containing protein [Calditrichota bacterium]